jgi:hypothetical protein
MDEAFSKISNLVEEVTVSRGPSPILVLKQCLLVFHIKFKWHACQAFSTQPMLLATCPE